MDIAAPAADPRWWLLDPEVCFLNHGSFGACPREVIAAQRALQDRLERQPLQFLARDLEGLLDAARAEVAGFVGAAPANLVFVPNATYGVNSVLRSLSLQAGDELLATTHGYNACLNALDFVAGRAGARVIRVELPFPIGDPSEVIDAILARVTPRTRLALLDHVTSPTGLVLPIAELVSSLRERGVEALVDGAHAPGMLPLELEALGAAYYTGNLHKWVCAPKGAAFLHVRQDLQGGVRPLAISHGANLVRGDRPRFWLEFDWTGTCDPSPYLCAPVALRTLGQLPGGWSALQARNQALALDAQGILADALRISRPAPAAMIGSLAALPLPPNPRAPVPGALEDPLQVILREEHRIEVRRAPVRIGRSHARYLIY